MRRHLLTLVVTASLATPLEAQPPAPAFDASLGANGAAWQAAISAWQPVLRVTSRVRVGAGLRLSAFGGGPSGYANRGTVQGGLAPIVSIDPSVYALNAAVFVEVHLARGLALGANLDLVGMAGGPERVSGTLTAKPQAFSNFRYGSADHGALNSEFFAALAVTPRVRIRAGVSHYVVDYVVTDAAATGAPSRRYQAFESVPFIAVRLQR